MLTGPKIDVAEGVRLWPGAIDAGTQDDVIADVLARANEAPFYRPAMPKSGKPFTVEETNFGPLGWVSDIGGYRYQPAHPVTKRAWPTIPRTLLDLWNETTGYAAPPECCLVNLYRGAAKMGLHQDRDEAAADAPVLSISLGDDALFRIGGTARGGPTKSIWLHSGDVLVFGGPARLAYHGIDRVAENSSTRVPGGGRLSLTLRRVTRP